MAGNIFGAWREKTMSKYCCNLGQSSRVYWFIQYWGYGTDIVIIKHLSGSIFKSSWHHNKLQKNYGFCLSGERQLVIVVSKNTILTIDSSEFQTLNV